MWDGVWGWGVVWWGGVWCHGEVGWGGEWHDYRDALIPFLRSQLEISVFGIPVLEVNI